MHHLSRPWSVLTGLFSQFFLLPATSFVLMKTFNLQGYFALGMLILSCSPSGTTSNIFTYYLDGDVPLSISMTVCSTVVAMVMMPFNMWLYGRTLETSSGINIPYVKMVRSLAYITAPVGMGMLIFYKFPKVAPYITKLGSMAAFAMIGVSQVMIFIIFPNIFVAVPSQLFVAVSVLLIAGLLVGYLFAMVTKRSNKACRTISIESGIQNVGMAITVITLTIDKFQEQALVFPLCYSYYMLFMCVSSCISYNLYMKFCAAKYVIDDEKKVPPRIAVDAWVPSSNNADLTTTSIQSR
ncbi:solute carrier family 10 member 6-like isoform X2 [Varroa jacobsoni]|nr:solute carrier family 10 member 6-like isoform X2 [Varroa destructor]XP_022643405.1 solute carrier family 10 member 6-like isoform X2 [Varroa destructor]XP_022702656.1 solute carrier family 10 member 6-like isoform X2 [Varroa jacobsoni]XP_022702657.1 solute carrier family 10 member 6-like isoform X2 [Varroa jacobsoni]